MLLHLFALAAFALLVTLGVWQLQRLAWKRDILARIEALNGAAAAPVEQVLARAAAGQDVNYIRVVADCPGLDQAPMLRLFVVYERTAGFLAISACRVGEGPYRSVLVDRGFVAEADAGRLPGRAPAPSPHRAVVGLLRDPGEPILVTAKNRPAENRWYGRDVAAMARALGADRPAPVFLMLESPPPPGFGPKPAPLPVQVSNRHLGYAVTWFGLAAALVGVWLAYVLRKPRTA